MVSFLLNARIVFCMVNVYHNNFYDHTSVKEQ